MKLMRCDSQMCLERNPCWYWLKRLMLSKWVMIFDSRVCSNSLEAKICSFKLLTSRTFLWTGATTALLQSNGTLLLSILIV